MAIDPLSEQLISLTEATKLCPRRRAGKQPHVSCAYRWTVAGCKGVVLESVQVGGTRCTSREALGRFFAKLTAQSGRGPVPTLRSPARREREVAAAIRELERAGA